MTIHTGCLDEPIDGSFRELARKGHEEGDIDCRRRLVFNREIMRALEIRVRRMAHSQPSVLLGVRDYCNTVGSSGAAYSGNTGKLSPAMVADFLTGFTVWLITNDSAFRALHVTASQMDDFQHYVRTLVAGLTTRNLIHSFFRETIGPLYREKLEQAYEHGTATEAATPSQKAHAIETYKRQVEGYSRTLARTDDRNSARYTRLQRQVIDRIRTDTDRDLALALLLHTMPHFDLAELLEPHALGKLFPKLTPTAIERCIALVEQYRASIAEHQRIIGDHNRKAHRTRTRIVETDKNAEQDVSGEAQAQLELQMGQLNKRRSHIQAHEQDCVTLRPVSESSLGELLGSDISTGRNVLKRAKRLFTKLCLEAYSRDAQEK